MMLILNGKLCEDNNIKYDSGYTFGRGVFETILVKDKPIFLEEHFLRMAEGIKKLNISNFFDIDYIKNMILKHDIKNCILKIIVSDKNVIFETRPSSYKQEDYERGFKLKVSDLKKNPYSITTYVKSLNYTDNIIEREKALKEGFDEVLFLNCHDSLAEGSVSNIFFIKDNRLFTPSVECGLLKGIMRSWVINNFKVQEGRFALDDIMNSEGVFLTNSVMGIMKVSSINNISMRFSDIVNNIRNKYEEFILL